MCSRRSVWQAEGHVMMMMMSIQSEDTRCTRDPSQESAQTVSLQQAVE